MYFKDPDGIQIELLSDPPTMQRVRQAQKDIDQGRFTTSDEMAQLLQQRGTASE